jgi:hypothetical protein
MGLMYMIHILFQLLLSALNRGVWYDYLNIAIKNYSPHK